MYLLLSSKFQKKFHRLNFPRNFCTNQILKNETHKKAFADSFDSILISNAPGRTVAKKRIAFRGKFVFLMENSLKFLEGRDIQYIGVFEAGTKGILTDDEFLSFFSHFVNKQKSGKQEIKVWNFLKIFAKY